MAINILVPPLPKTPIAKKAEALFDAHFGSGGQSMKNHCLRIYSFTCHLLERQNIKVDRGLLYFISLLHDHSYVRRSGLARTNVEKSLAFILREAEEFGLDEKAKDTIRFCVFYKYHLFAINRHSPEADAFRKAIVIESTSGLFNYGLPALQLLGIFRHYARHNINRILWGLWTAIIAQLFVAPFSRAPKK